MFGYICFSAGYKDVYYKKSQQVRRMVQDKTNEILKEFDFILSPTTPHTAFNIGQKQSDPTAMYLEDIFTVHGKYYWKP